MGLSIAWEFYVANLDEEGARSIVERLRQVALDLPVAGVSDLIEMDPEELKRFNQSFRETTASGLRANAAFFLGMRYPEALKAFEADPNLERFDKWSREEFFPSAYECEPYECTEELRSLLSSAQRFDTLGHGLDPSSDPTAALVAMVQCARLVQPDRVVAFMMRPGSGCEPANFGLCHYVEDVDDEGEPQEVIGGSWGFSAWSKTQYASNPDYGGIANFLRCHLAVVRVLDEAKRLGIVREISDDGDYWESRCMDKLTASVTESNILIAGISALIDAQTGVEPVSAPIARFPNIELLEAQGVDALTRTNVGELTDLIQRLGRLAGNSEAA